MTKWNFLTYSSIYVNKSTSIQLIISKKHMQIFPLNIKTNEVVSFRGKEGSGKGEMKENK